MSVQQERGEGFRCFGEEGFADWMEQEVEPFLAAHRRDGYLRCEDGTNLYYQYYATDDAEKCIVICHGFCEFAEKYYEFIYYFLQHGYVVYLCEHRGHGRSDRVVPDLDLVHVTDYQEYVKDFVCFVNQVVVPGEKRRFLFAHSMGGAIGALTMEQYPGLFEAAVLSSPMCGMQTGRYPNWMADAVAWYCCRTGRGMQYAAGQSGFLGTPDFEGSSCLSEARYQNIFQKRLNDERCRTYGGSYAWVHAGIKATRELMKQKNLDKIRIPVLVFAADQDHMVDNHAIEQFVALTAGAELIRVQDAKHEIFHSGPVAREGYYRDVFAFYERY